MLARLLSRELVQDGIAPHLDPGRCVRGRFTRASCRRCADACPRGAIAIGKGPPVVSSGACAGCRLCQASCPAGALGDPHELDRAIDEMSDRPRPVLGCRRPGVEAHGRIACLGMLDAEALLALAASFPGGLTLNLAHCRACANGAVVPPVLRGTLGRLASLPGSLPRHVRAAESLETLRFEHDALSRREFFSIFRGRPGAAGSRRARAREAAPEPHTAKRLPAGRRALLRVLDRLPLPPGAAAEGGFFPSLTFSPACRGCTGCAGVCPTGALTTDASDRPRPVFEPSACTGCALCVEFCRRGAPVLSTGLVSAPFTACG